METNPRHDDDTPETAEPQEAEELSEKVPDEASGEGDTPLGDTDPAGAAVLAARAFLAGQPGVTGSVTVRNGTVTVRTRAAEPTIFLTMIGIDRVTATGSAEADIVPSGRTR